MTIGDLREAVERVVAATAPDREEARAVVASLLDALEAGEVRAAEPSGGGWVVHAWVKRGLLLAFRHGVDETTHAPPFHFRDRDTLRPRDPSASAPGVRLVPGGTTVRRGAHIGAGVILMPPSFVNLGAFVGDATMIDSHALVGSCAQVGSRVHVSAAAQIGGVLEPPGAMPVIVEDDAFLGGGSGVYEGARVGRGAVLAPGVILTRSVPIHDLVHERTVVADASGILAVPERAVVVPGHRPAAGAWAQSRGLGLYAPMIVKYRDAATDAASALESALR